MNFVSDISKRFEERYRRGQAPWSLDTIPNEVKKFVEILREYSSAGKILDIGCGDGWAAIYLAKQGFDVTGIDSSKTAILSAIKTAHTFSVECRFIIGNALEPRAELYDAIFDRGFLYHVPEESWSSYFALLENNLKRNGLYYLSVFSDKSVKKGFSPRDSGRMWNTVKEDDVDCWTYDHFFNAELIEKLFSTRFEIIFNTEDEGLGSNGSHLLHYIFRKKQ